MSKKLIYICSREAKLKKCSKGVISKIELQNKQFNLIGYNTLIQAPKPKHLEKIEVINPFLSSLNWSNIKCRDHIDAVYIRLVRIDFPFIKLLAKIRKENKDVKILFEFPSYPYKGELVSNQGKLIYYKDLFYSDFLRFFVDRIVLTVPGYQKLFGIKVLYVPNGVEYDNKKVMPRINDDGVIHLLAVASMSVWHGYDRIIRGFAEYYAAKNDVKIVLHLAGVGAELKRYKYLVKKHHLEKYVIFEGFCEGEKLNELYKKCHIGLGSLGVHRTWDGKVISSLKLKEYASKGLPFVIEGICDMEDDTTRKYILRVPSDETPINISKIIDFCKSVYAENKAINNMIKEEFRRYYDMDKLFEPVIDFLDS